MGEQEAKQAKRQRRMIRLTRQLSELGKVGVTEWKVVKATVLWESSSKGKSNTALKAVVDFDNQKQAEGARTDISRRNMGSSSKHSWTAWEVEATCFNKSLTQRHGEGCARIEPDAACEARVTENMFRMGKLVAGWRTKQEIESQPWERTNLREPDESLPTIEGKNPRRRQQRGLKPTHG